MLWYFCRRAWLLMWASDEEIAATLDRDIEFGRRVWHTIITP
jgi:hypothetical protein